jgi:hypothetical protein
MSWTRILLFYVVALVLTLHLKSVTDHEAGETEAAKAPTTPFLTAVPERIDRVRFESSTLALQFERKDGRWVTTEPEGLAPPGDVIDAVLDSFATLPPIEIVSAGKDNEDQFGLVPPRMRIRIEQAGELISTVVLGELSPTRTAVYARKSGSDEVALIGLNAKYYIDLVFENVRRQRASAGIPLPEAGVAPDAGAPGLPPAMPGAPPPAGAIPTPGAMPPAAITPPAGSPPAGATPPAVPRGQ